MTVSKSLRSLIAAQAVAFLASMGTVFLTAYLLGPDGRGRIAFVLASANLMGALGFGSLHVGVVRATGRGCLFAPRHGLDIAMKTAGGMTGLTLLMSLFISVFSGSEERAWAVLLAGLGASMVTVNLYLLRTIQAFGDDAGFRMGWFIQSSILVGVGGPVLWLLPAVYPFILVWLAGTAASSIYAWRRRKWPRGQIGKPQGRNIVADSLKVHIGAVGTQILTRMPIVALGVFSTSSAVGVYSVAAPVSELTWVISEAFSLLAFRMSALRDAKESDDARVAKIHAAITVFIALLVAVASFAILPTILPAFENAAPLVAVLLPGVLLQGAARVALSRIAGRGDSKIGARLGILAALSSLVFFPAAAYGDATVVAATASVLFSAQAVLTLFIDRRLALRSHQASRKGAES